MGNVQISEELVWMASEMLQATGCSELQTERYLNLFSRINEIPWDTAQEATEHDDWDIHAFVERLDLPEGLLEKGLIISDHSGRVSRWDTLGNLLVLESPWRKTGIAEPALLDLLESMQELAKQGYYASVEKAHDKPSYLRFWRRPGQIQSLKCLMGLLGMTTTCVGGMTVRTLIETDPGEDRNPYEALLQIFERGLLLDWDNWQYTNMSLENLGRIPEPML